MLLTTQYLAEADALAGSVVFIDAGRVVATGTPAELKARAGQPVLIVVLADFLFGGAIKTGTHSSYINFVMPGILVVAAAFAAVTTTISVAADMGEGVIDRFRTLPMAKSAVITGHVIADLARSLIGLAVTIAAGVAVGFRPAAGTGRWATAVAVFLLVTLALSLLAALIGLLGKSVEVAQQLAAIIIIPIFFSSALVPAATMPSWLRVVTASQPITQAVDTLRALLAGQPPGSHLWRRPWPGSGAACSPQPWTRRSATESSSSCRRRRTASRSGSSGWPRRRTNLSLCGE